MSELTEPKTAKKGGPYSTNQRRIRREKVAELFFEKSYPAVAISRMLNVNRNTVTNDLKYCYSELKKERYNFNAVTICMTQFHRMEIQRKRLVEYLLKELEFRDRLALERTITDLENKILQAALRLEANADAVAKFATAIFNMWAKEQNSTFRGISSKILQRVSQNAKEKIDKIIKEDEKNSNNSCLAGYY